MRRFRVIEKVLSDCNAKYLPPLKSLGIMFIIMGFESISSMREHLYNQPSSSHSSYCQKDTDH